MVNIKRLVSGCTASIYWAFFVFYSKIDAKMGFENMERVVDAGRSPEVFENDIQYFLAEFCAQNGIVDMTVESQSRWSAALIYVQKNVFPDRSVLMSDKRLITDSSIMSSNYNAYDYDLVDNVLDYYIYLCLMYDKEITGIGFSLMSGIKYNTINEWGKDNRKLSHKNYELVKKLRDFREYSLSNKLSTGNKNPVGILAILNRFYSWNLPGVSRETQRIATRTPEEIAASYGDLSGKDAQLTLPQVPD